MANIKKISVATVYGKIKLAELMKAPEQTLPIMRVLGSAVGTKTGDSQYGPWTALQGMFEATNLDTGEKVRASQLFLPDVALTPILVQLMQPGVQGVEFAIDVSAKYVEDAKPGGSPYEYTFDTVLQADESDPIKRLNDKITALALPAPGAKSDPDAAKASPATKTAPKGRK